MDANTVRINKAWQQTREWITQFEGSASEAFLPNLETSSLPLELVGLAGETKSYRMAAVAPDNSEKEIPITPESIHKNLEDYLQGELDGLIGNFTAQLEGFDVDFHFILHLLRGNSIGMELVWWADQVFEEDTDAKGRFDQLMNYLIHLQEAFKAPELFIGQENIDRPGVEAIDWVNI